MRFLVVDDSRAMQSIVRRGLQKAGYLDLDIKVANDGLEALEIIKVWSPDMVFSDWHIPHMSGLELLNTIKRQMLDVKIGFVTTESAPERLQEARAAGALFIVNKPFSDDDLVRAVVGAIETTSPANPTHQDETSELIEEKAGSEDIAMTNANAAEQLRLPSGDLLAQTINRIARFEVFAEEIAAINLNDMIMPCILGMFEDANQRSRAVIIMDLRTVCILGASVSGETPQAVRANILRQTISPEALKGCRQILENAASVVSVRSTQRALKLRSVTAIPAIFPKLELLYARRNVDRSDYEIAAATYGQGLMTIIAT